jgi:serine/threonine protein phosphatase 1
MAYNDYNKVYFPDAFLVTGHLPTFQIDESYRGKIYRANNHIAIDTGAVFGETLSCLCLETNEEFYV